MILTERTINIIDHESIMDSPVVLYRGDKNVELKLNIKSSRFKFRDDSSSNFIESAQASYGQLIIETPNQNEPIFSEITATKKGYIIFVITAEMIDEIDEVGNYTFQVRLLDSNKRSRATIPPVVNGIEIREPITSEDSNVLNSAVVGLASAANEEVLDTFDFNGNYDKTNWKFGDKITASKLNKAEDGIYQSYALGLNNTSQIKDIENNKATLQECKEEIAKVQLEGAGVDTSNFIFRSELSSHKSVTGQDILINHIGSINISSSKPFYSGSKNLLVFDDYTETKNGVTVNCENGVITFSGTCSGGVEFYIPTKDIPLKKSINYTCFISKDSSLKGFDLCYDNYGGKALTMNYGEKSNTLTPETDFTIKYIRVYVTRGEFNQTYKIVLQCGTPIDMDNFIYSSIQPTYNESTVTSIDVDSIPFYLTCDSDITVQFYEIDIKDYTKMYNKPTLNGIELNGDIELEIPFGDNFSRHKPYSKDIGKYTVSHSTTRVLSNNNGVNSIVNNEINQIFSYSCNMRQKPSYPTDMAIQDMKRQLGYVVEFYANCSQLEVCGYGGYGTRIVFAVNDAIVSNELSYEEDNGYHFFYINFDTKAKRKISLFITGVFGGVNTEDGGEISKYINTKPLLITDGDSIVEGVSQIGVAQSMCYSWPAVMSKILGCNLYNAAIGGSGYIKLGNQGEPNMVDRFDDYIGKYNPDILVVSAGLNDMAESEMDFETAVDNYWSHVKEAISSKYIIVVSPFNPKITVNTSLEKCNQICKKIAKKYKLPYIDIINGKTYDALGGMITDYGEGIINEDNIADFIGDDTTHPTINGDDYIGKLIANEVYKIIKNDFGLFIQ